MRKAISDDLAEIRRLNRVDDPAWWSILEDGYKRAWDQKGLDWIRAERARQLQNTPYGFKAAYEKWMRDNPYPMGEASPDKLAARRRALLDQTAAWIRQWPDDVGAWTQRFYAVTDGSGATSGRSGCRDRGSAPGYRREAQINPARHLRSDIPDRRFLLCPT